MEEALKGSGQAGMFSLSGVYGSVGNVGLWDGAPSLVEQERPAGEHQGWLGPPGWAGLCCGRSDGLLPSSLGLSVSF